MQQPDLLIIEEEQAACEKVFAALHELLDLFDSNNQPDIEDHVAIKNMGVRIAELSLVVQEGLLNCLKYDRNTYFPRVALIPTWARVHDAYCQFAVEWCAKYSRYENPARKKGRAKTREEDKLLRGYTRSIEDEDFMDKKKYIDEDITMICETVTKSLLYAGEQMYGPEKHSILEDEYNDSLYMIINDAISILAYGIQCFMGMLIRLEKESEKLYKLNDKGNCSFMRQYERFTDKHGKEMFMDMLRHFDPSADENNLPHITKHRWKKFVDLKLAEIMGSPIGRDCIAKMSQDMDGLPFEELGYALAHGDCSMEDCDRYMRLFYEYEIGKKAHWSMKEWEKDDISRITALDFYDRLKKSIIENEQQGAKKRAKRSRDKMRITPDTYTYKWLATDENRLERLFQMLQNNAKWIDAKESPDNFYALFKGEPSEFHISWCGTKQHLYHLFKEIFARGLVTWGRKNGQWRILQNHFNGKHGLEFTSFNGEKESIKARATIEKLVDIIDPAVSDNE